MSHINKIAATSPSRQKPSELETSIASAIYDLESNTADMRSALRPLQFVSAKEVRYVPAWGNEDGCQMSTSGANILLLLLQIEVGHGKKAIVIFVPVPLLAGFHKVQQR